MALKRVSKSASQQVSRVAWPLAVVAGMMLCGTAHACMTWQQYQALMRKQTKNLVSPLLHDACIEGLIRVGTSGSPMLANLSGLGPSSLPAASLVETNTSSSDP